ncbi:MAG TPA: acyl-CoA thioesterase [Alphaproteobacteria bacterium]|nr:acyl-CoA thioesterase [Alphaproteobacteria bacterium]
MPHHYDVLIRETHIDSLGHMNNAAYLTLFEEARWDWITAGGYGVAEIRQYKQSPIILEVTVKFMREVLLREKLRIVSEITSYEGKVGNLKQVMQRADGTVCSEAFFKMGFFDLDTRRLIEPTPRWRQALGI